MNAPQIPTVGRVVHFYEYASQPEPFAAIIVRVYDQPGLETPQSFVNLDVVDPITGLHRFICGVGPGDEISPGWHYRWPKIRVA